VAVDRVIVQAQHPMIEQMNTLRSSSCQALGQEPADA
jgi:hypothetical protein